MNDKCVFVGAKNYEQQRHATSIMNTNDLVCNVDQKMQTGVCSYFILDTSVRFLRFFLRASHEIRYFQFTEKGTVNGEQWTVNSEREKYGMAERRNDGIT